MSAKTERIVNDLTEVIKSANATKTTPFDSKATVTRVDRDGVMWVHFDGGVIETPVRKTIEAKPGDTVQVRVSGGDAFLVGNATSPPTDDTRARKAGEVADDALDRVVQVSDYVAAHLYLTDEGLNVLHDRDGYRVIIGNRNVYIVDENGNIVNSMTDEGNTIGRDDKSHMELYPGSIYALNGSSTPLFGIDMNGALLTEDRTYRLGNFQEVISEDLTSVQVKMYGDPGAEIEMPFNSFIITPPNHGNDEFKLSTLEISGNCSIKESRYRRITIDVDFDAEEIGTEFTYSGEISVTGISSTDSSEYLLHFTFDLTYDGTDTIIFSIHNQDDGTFGYRIIPEISFNTTLTLNAPSYFLGSVLGEQGIYSAAIGQELYASGTYQLVIGKFNEEDTENEYAFIIGNGIGEDSRSNAFTVDKYGNIAMALDMSAPISTEDGDLRTAIESLGWDSEVIF